MRSSTPRNLRERIVIHRSQAHASVLPCISLGFVVKVASMRRRSLGRLGDQKEIRDSESPPYSVLSPFTSILAIEVSVGDATMLITPATPQPIQIPDRAHTAMYFSTLSTTPSPNSTPISQLHAHQSTSPPATLWSLILHQMSLLHSSSGITLLESSARERTRRRCAGQVNVCVCACTALLVVWCRDGFGVHIHACMLPCSSMHASVTLSSAHSRPRTLLLLYLERLTLNSRQNLNIYRLVLQTITTSRYSTTCHLKSVVQHLC